jgi:DNA-binding response OmpR family regulator
MTSSDIPASNSPSPEQRRPRVLLVDDDPEIVEAMRYALEANGFDVSVARDGNQGLALTESLMPDLLILDMMMPKRSGFLVLEQLRRSGNDKVKVIMITANEGNRHKAYAELLGVNDYLRKPFAMNKLVESAARLTRTESQPDSQPDSIAD